MIESDFSVPFIADLALREKQIQQNYRPAIAVHKWFARRPGTLFRGLLLSEFVAEPLPEAFYRAHDLRGRRVADPFMGGGTPLMEANRLGCDVYGCDINPMAYWIVRQEIEHLDLPTYRREAARVRTGIGAEIGHLLRTTCVECGCRDADVKYWLWVKTMACRNCDSHVRLFPGYLVAENRRHPLNVFACAACGRLTETARRDEPGPCRHCGVALVPQGPARANRCLCSRCGTTVRYPDPSSGAPTHELFAIEYHCAACRAEHRGRFFKAPDAQDTQRVSEAEGLLAGTQSQFIPDEEIPAGDETDRLHRWGYTRYRQMFSPRQLLGLELSCRAIVATSDQRVRQALATNLSDLLRYQNLLCRYDTMALKSLDIFSVHGFPVGLVQCESNLLGIVDGRGTNIGSGGWSNIIEKYAKAKEYCEHPFEVRHHGARKCVVPIRGEWIGERSAGQTRQVQITCGDSTCLVLAPASLDAVLTDPPYYGNVQYAELMDFCYVWLRRLVGDASPAFRLPSTRHAGELTGNANLGRGLEHFAEGLSAVFQRMAAALKPGSPLAFTFHHNQIEAYLPVAAALLDARLVCSASLPCPAEMGASIHISGTGSSIVDTVFVCRSTGRVPRRWVVSSPAELAGLVRADVNQLAEGGMKPTRGDLRCLAFGHATRLAIWSLRHGWCRDSPLSERLDRLRNLVLTQLRPEEAVASLDDLGAPAIRLGELFVAEGEASYRGESGAIPF